MRDPVLVFPASAAHLPPGCSTPGSWASLQTPPCWKPVGAGTFRGCLSPRPWLHVCICEVFYDSRAPHVQPRSPAPTKSLRQCSGNGWRSRALRRSRVQDTQGQASTRR